MHIATPIPNLVVIPNEVRNPSFFSEPGEISRFVRNDNHGSANRNSDETVSPYIIV